MEIVIVICLLIIIILLLQDKMVLSKRSKQNPMQQKVNPNLSDIMGQPKPEKSLSLPNRANQSPITEQEINRDNLDIEYDEHENVAILIPQEEPEETFSNTPDLEEEEAAWNAYGIYGSEDGFAQGVTFEELSTVGTLLQKEQLEPDQKHTAAAIVHKLQGTELFSLLENSFEDASRRIAGLLDSSLNAETPTGSSIMRKNDWNDFDIGAFV